MIKISEIISGGQSGVDRAALDFALENGIECGGHCPKGRIAEDGYIDTKYPLQETISSNYSVRTRRNVACSDGTIILIINKMDRGTIITKQIARKTGKPVISLNLDAPQKPEILSNWMKENNIGTVNIAGPRESFSPGIYLKALEFLRSNISLF